jgi:hypothetical protein
MSPFAYNLPKLKTSGGGMPDPSATGVWLPLNDVDALANRMDVGADQLSRDDVKSVPDPWAQFLVFDRALFDSQHLLHETVRTQWRALLATIALQPEFSAHYTLSTTVYDLKTSDSLFARTLLSLEPKRRLTTEAAWSTTIALTLHERGRAASFSGPSVIGYLTPTALVAAGRSSDGVRCAAAPWLANGLTDPTKVALSDRQFRILANYVGAVWDALKDRKDLDAGLKTSLAEALKAFHDDLAAKAAPDGVAITDAHAQFAATTSFHQKVLGKTWTQTDIAPEQSEAALAISGPIRELFEGVILVDPTLTATLDKGAESITVWGRHSLASALQPNTYAAIVEEAEAAGWLLIRPEDIFTDSLVQLESQMANAAHPAAFQSALLPLSPLALLLAPKQQLARDLDMTPTASAAQVRLRLKLASGRHHMLSREIPRAEAGDAAPQVPDDLAFWPNFQAEGWKWTFLHYTAATNYYMRPRFAVTADFIAKQVRGYALDRADRARWVRRWADSSKPAVDEALFGAGQTGGPNPANRHSSIVVDNEVLLERIGFQATDTTLRELHRLPGGVDAVFFSRKLESGDFTPAGMALVKFDEPTSSSATAKVAVDFGTTNTVVYSQQNGPPNLMTFADRVVFPFDARSKQATRREKLVGHYLSFFPLQDHDTPLPTVAKLQEFKPPLPAELDAKMRDGRMGEHGFADNIFFVPNFDGFVRQQAMLGASKNVFADMTSSGHLKYRLKWGKGTAERGRASRFLRQIKMMSAAELVANGVSPQAITWRFSYPQAFKPRAQEQLEKEIANNIDDLFGRAEKPNGAYLHKTESAAAAHFFMEKGASKLMLMFDIGGRTTDVALWRAGEIFWRSSFEIAGGDFFTAYLANNPAILRKINLDEVADGVEGVDGKVKLDDAGRKNIVELYVNKPSFAKQFSVNYGRLASEPLGQGLHQVAAATLGGLFYYVGMVLSRLLEKDGEAAPVMSANDLRSLTIAFAGRGSTFFRHFDSRSDKSELKQLARLALVAANHGAHVDIDVLFSDGAEAKHEVAKGLLIDRREGPEAKVSRLAVLGEEVQAIDPNGAVKPVPANQPLSALSAIREIDEVDLGQFKTFLSALGQLTGIHISGAAPRSFDQIQSHVRQALTDEVRELEEGSFRDPDTLPLTPPFILALQRLVTLMASPIAARREVLSVRDDNDDEDEEEAV